MVKNRSKSSRISLLFIMIYNTLLITGGLFLAPLLLPLVWTTEKRRRTFCQRMGWCRYPWETEKQSTESQRIWVHALSVGEAMSAFTLVKQLGELHPGAKIFFTASTLTGFQTARQHFGKQRVHIGYFPYDCILAVRMAFAKIRPTRVIITETDIWPTFLWEMQRRRVPVDMVNLRISDRTWKNYRRFRWLAGSLYAHFERVCVQTATEKRRLIKLGVSEDRIRITGSLKFDAAAASGSAKQLPMPFDDLCLPRGHRVIVAGSTHEGEEEMLCEALKPILFKDPGITLMVVPRDPERSAAIQSVCRQHGLKVQRFSRMAAMQGKIYPQVVVVDAIGLLKDLYRMAYFAIIGGSLAPYGGHNPLEPAFWGKPILFGKDMQDFALIAEYLLTGGAALQVNDVDALQAVVVHLLKQPDTVQRMGQRALKVVNDHRGAVHRTLSHLELAA